MLNRDAYNTDDALLAAANHLRESLRHLREARAIVADRKLSVAIPDELALLTAFSDCHLQRRVPVRVQTNGG